MSVSGGVSLSSFAYDGDGNRVAQTVGTATYNYVNDVASELPVVLQESGPDGAISYAYGNGLIFEAGSGFEYFQHHDGLGSVIGLSDATGTLREGYAYDAWGNASTSVGNVGTQNKFRFTGEALDPGTQLYYLRARYDHHSVGRFVTADRFPGFVQLPLSRNKYIYVNNDPINLRDPSGLQGVTQSLASWLDDNGFGAPKWAGNPQNSLLCQMFRSSSCGSLVSVFNDVIWFWINNALE